MNHDGHLSGAAQFEFELKCKQTLNYPPIEIGMCSWRMFTCSPDFNFLYLKKRKMKYYSNLFKMIITLTKIE